jgi:hypothetical protein
MVRRGSVVALALLIIGGLTWVLWPATSWPETFCAPVVRVVGADAGAIAKSFSHPATTLTVAQEDQVNKLMYDLTLAVGAAPTAQLRSELHRYLAQLGAVLTTNVVTDAMSQFDLQARTQLRACGVTPIGS